jgi:hypothetical protein
MTNEKHAVDSTRGELKQEIHAYKNEPSVLSPAAQVVLDAAFAPWETTDTPQSIAAAALRAAVQGIDYITSEEILAIADELDGLS